MRFIVTTDVKDIPPTPVAMVDGTVPGFEPQEEDLHFDHHRVGGALCQIDEIPLDEISLQSRLGQGWNRMGWTSYGRGLQPKRPQRAIL